MMFLLDFAFATVLIALGIGIAFLIWAYRNDGVGITLGKVFGYIITIAAVISLLCTSYYGITYWVEGYFKSPLAPLTMQKHQGMMEQCPIMKECMKKNAIWP